jgi:hypothetical protein
VSLFQRGGIWGYEFWFAGRRIRESSKSESKTLAKTAEKNRRRELEEGFNNVADVRRERVRAIGDIADEFLEEYKLRSHSRQPLRSMLSVTSDVWLGTKCSLT